MTAQLERVWHAHAGDAWAGAEPLADAISRLEASGQSFHHVETELEAFVRALATAFAHAKAKQQPVSLEDLATDDLYLAVATLGGDPAAVAVFGALVGPDLDRVVGRLVPPADRADTRQRLSQRLLVGDGSKEPALSKYRGSGSLRAWVRAVATRALIDEKRASARNPALQPWEGQPDVEPAREIELRVALGKHANTVRAALERAFAKLSPRQRNLIRYSLFHGLGIDELAALYGVHRSSAARWLQRARADLAQGVEAAFADGVGGPADDAASLLRQLRSRMNVSIRSFLASSLEAEPDTDPA